MSVPRLDAVVLPEPFARWFAARGWAPRAHQLALLEKARAGRSALLIAPTGAGKTLAGFLPTLVELSERARTSAGRTPSLRALSSRSGGLHTLYISPLKALAVDVARNLDQPVAEIGLAVRIETRTGDTPAGKRMRQRRYPPDILLTTPEQLALLLSTADAPYLFGTVRRIVLDELHALVTSKRGDLLSLGLARLNRLAPGATATGLSATVAEPGDLCRYLVPQPPGGVASADLIVAEGGAAPVVTMLDTAERLPWAGHSARHALGEIYELIKQHRTTLMFVNTRSQAEMLFQELWRINDDGLAIALHHGSLDAAQRRKIEAAMAAARLQAVVCTSSLDLGIDWGERGHAVTRSIADSGAAVLAGTTFALAAAGAVAGAGEITVAGVPLLADVAGALYWPEEGLLVVSDLHLEKGSAFAARGVLMPPYDTASTLQRLAGLLARYAVHLVVALGDNFHDGGGPARLGAADRAHLLALQQGRDWVWIAGNHDPDPREGIGGAFARSLALGPLSFRHEPAAAPGRGATGGGSHGATGSHGEIAGHLHPAARVHRRGHTLTRKCFATDGARLVMPAFGAYTGGLNIRDIAFLKVFGALGFTAHLLGRQRLYSFAAARCLAD